MVFRGLKMSVKNEIFWSEIGSAFGEPGGTPPPRIPRSTPWFKPIKKLKNLI